MIPTDIQIALAALVIALLLPFHEIIRDYLSIRPYAYLNKDNVPVDVFWLDKQSAIDINQMTDKPSLKRLSVVPALVKHCKQRIMHRKTSDKR